VAVGWTGTWFARFEKNKASGLSLRAGMKELDTYLPDDRLCHCYDQPV